MNPEARARVEARRQARGVTIALWCIVFALGATLLTVILISKADGPPCYVSGCDERGTRPVRVCKEHHKGAYFLECCEQHKEMWSGRQ